MLRKAWRWLKAREFDNDAVLLLLNPYFIPKKLLRDALRREVHSQNGSLMVDVGCGWKPYRHLFAHYSRYLGLDAAVERKPDCVASAEQLPLLPAIADAVLCTEVIEHTRDPKQVCADLAAILKAGGTLFLSAPMSWNLHYAPNDYYRFTCYGLTHLLETAGLEILKVVRIGGLVSLIGARLADVAHRSLLRLPLLRRLRGREALAAALVSPINAAFFLLGWLFDRVDATDAIGWLVVARKSDATRAGKSSPEVTS